MRKLPRGLQHICFIFAIASCTLAQSRPRARDLGIPFDGNPGPLNAITDVNGVEVGHTTLISGQGKLQVGVGPVRTGVTAVLPRGKNSTDDVFAGWFTLNGNGEMTGTTWVEDSGFLDGPIMITNTHSVGVVRDAVIAWRVKHAPPDDEGYWWSLPVVAETWDGVLNDVNGFHVKPEHVFHALDSAHAGLVEEGSVGGGTGMVCNEFKGGIGTASRVLNSKQGGYTVGVLVQCNYGDRGQLRIAGIPVGREITENKVKGDDVGSIIVVVATDAPLIPTQLKRVARYGYDDQLASGGKTGEERAPRSAARCRGDDRSGPTHSLQDLRGVVDGRIDVHVGPQVPREPLLLGPASDRDGVKSHFSSELDRQMPEAADAVHGDQVPAA